MIGDKLSEVNTVNHIVALGGVLLGWFLGQGADLLKKWLFAVKLKASLLKELEDLKEELKRTRLIYERKLQICAHGGIEPSVPLGLSDYFFRHYYQDVFAKLNREQRLSYQLIHAHVASVNEGIVTLGKQIIQCCRTARSESTDADEIRSFVDWESQLKAQYANVLDALWHVEYHLRNPECPELRPSTDTHNEYVQFYRDIPKRINDIMDKAKKCKLSDFE